MVSKTVAQAAADYRKRKAERHADAIAELEADVEQLSEMYDAVKTDRDVLVERHDAMTDRLTKIIDLVKDKPGTVATEVRKLAQEALDG